MNNPAPAPSLPVQRFIECHKCALGTKGGYWRLIAAGPGTYRCPTCGQPHTVTSESSREPVVHAFDLPTGEAMGRRNIAGC